MSRSGRLEVGDNILRTLVEDRPTLWRNWPAKQSNSLKKCKIKDITPFEVIQGHRSRYQINWKPICDFLSVINSNWHPVSYRFRVITAYCSNFGHFVCLSPPPPFGAWDNVQCSSWAHSKAHSGLPVSVNWIFLLGVTAEALWANIGAKSVILLQRGPVDPKFQVEWVVPTKHSFSQKTRLNDLGMV